MGIDLEAGTAGRGAVSGELCGQPPPARHDLHGEPAGDAAE